MTRPATVAPGASGLLALALALALAPAPRPLAAQEPGTWAADRARLAELLGRTTPRDTATHDGWRLVPVLPTVRLVWNSDLPHSLNDGPLWAGRGLSTSVTGGVGATGTIGGWRVRAVLGPTVVASANRPFQVIPGADPARSSFSSPWHVGQASADLPLRMGDRSLLVLDPGTSTLAVSRGAVEVGATTSPEWWGPGIRNALVLSTNGPGVPRLYLGTARPVRTAVGAVEARLLAGTLTESLFFDSLAANDYRSLSGFLVTLRPAGEPGLTLGLARVAVAPIAGAGGSLSHALDALVRWESIAAPDDTLADGRSRQRVDQVLSLFGRWVVPHGLEVYGEWARMEL
ncbi:MAG TPA: hypothetical protein VEA99_12995, partial [Gemmatimonadaceae bacterium]|nr:hypothetical protein [Gemmatimonadaceae bacterium]